MSDDVGLAEERRQFNARITELEAENAALRAERDALRATLARVRECKPIPILSSVCSFGTPCCADRLHVQALRDVLAALQAQEAQP